MWWNLVFLTVLSLNFGTVMTQVVSVPSIMVSSFGMYNDSDRVFYTSLTQASVLANYDPSMYPVNNDLIIGMLAEFPPNCSCPDLRPIHSVTTAGGLLKFERAEMITSGMVDHGFAGYLAPFPGYCSADRAQLVEYYSEITNKYRYDTAYHIDQYYFNYASEYRPVRVLGYGYFPNENIRMIINTEEPSMWDLMFFKTISVRFDIVHQLEKDGKISYVVSSNLINRLVTEEGWTDNGPDQKRPGPISLRNNIETIKEKCGATYLQRCRETFDPSTGLYRPINLDRSPLGDKTIVGDCGYYMDTYTCFPGLQEFFSFAVNGTYMGSESSTTRAMYESLDHSSSGDNSLGFASWRTFSLLKL